MDDRNPSVNLSTSPRSRTTRHPRSHRPLLENLEGRALLSTLAPIGPVTVPAGLGYQVPLDGGAGDPQTYRVTSSNPQVQASVAQGNFLTLNVSHTSSGANDPSYSGQITFQLFEDLTPNTVNKIETLVNQGFYTGKNFHRIASGFPGPNDYILQGGSVNGSGSGEVNQPGFPFADEFVQQLAFTGSGQLAMANAGDDTNSSQFFITTGSPRFLDFQHTIFGQVVSGDPTIMSMIDTARNGTTPVSPILIDSATLSPTNPDGVIHVDATNAPVGATSTITVTATDPNDGSTVTRTFDVSVTQNTTQERPFLEPVPNQVVGLTKTTSPVQGQTDIFQIPAVDPNVPPVDLTYIVQGGVSNGAFTNVKNATASVDANGVVTVVPTAGFTGVIDLLVGVGGPNASTSTPSDFDTQPLTLTVTNGSPVNLQPIAISETVPVVTSTQNSVQLQGLTANPNSDQTLTYEILSNPTNGTVSNFDAQNGTFTYTPNGGFLGTDTLTFRVRDQGDPGPSLVSEPATVTLTVGGGDTGAVRVLSDILVITPPPNRTSVPNTINVNLVNGNLQVVVNGLLDLQQPASTSISRIVFYGSKKDDLLAIAPDITQPALLNGGQGGMNILNAGGGAVQANLWYGQTSITGSPRRDMIYGRLRRFQVQPSEGGDLVFAGTPGMPATLHSQGAPPRGQFYRLLNNRLIPLPQAQASHANPQNSPLMQRLNERLAARRNRT